MNAKKFEVPFLSPKQNSQRLIALEAARGLAVVGMFVQHFALNQTNNFVSGNTMILFILCSGISYSIMAQHMAARSRDSSVFRIRILTRSVFIDFVGYLLIMLNGPFAVVFPTYAMLFLLALTLIRRSTRVLCVISSVSFLVCPPLMLLGMSLFEGVDLLQDIAGGPLSALAWTPVFVTGMIIGRFNLRHNWMPFRLLVVGLAVLIPFKLIAVFVLADLQKSFMEWLLTFSDYYNAQIDPYAIWPLNTQPVQWQMLVFDAPQGGSSFELLIGTGLSLIILALLFLLEKRCAVILKPFSATGRVALTLYAGQYILVWGLQLAGINIVGIDIGAIPFGDILVVSLVLVTGCLLARMANGPLESLIRRFERMFDHGQ